MKKVSVFIGAILLFISGAPLSGQENFTEGAISRVILVDITRGHFTEYWADIRQNLKPIYEEYKKQGVISDYSFFTKATAEAAGDWDVGVVLTYKNYAALDGLAARTDPITLKFYGSRDARAAAARKRTEHSTLVSSFLTRTVDPKPMTSNP